MFVVDRYECFIENKNKNVSAVNLKKRTFSLIKILLVFINKAQRHWPNFEIHRTLKLKK